MTAPSKRGFEPPLAGGPDGDTSGDTWPLRVPTNGEPREFWRFRGGRMANGGGLESLRPETGLNPAILIARSVITERLYFQGVTVLNIDEFWPEFAHFAPF